MGTNTPADTDLLADTDLFIRRVAEYADTRLAGTMKIGVADAADYRTNSNGDIGVPFPTLGTITGCVLYVCGPNFVQPMNNKIPNPPNPGLPYTIPATPAWIQLQAFNPGGSLVWARIMVGSYPVASTAYYMGAQPAASNQLVSVAGIAWGPA